MSEKRKSVDENLKWFVDFLPSEVFYSLSSEDQVHYGEYKKYKGLKEKSENRIDDFEKQIKSLQEKIKEEKIKIKGDFENDGYKSKMKKHYDSITSVEKDFSFNCSIEERNRSSKSHKIKTGKIVKTVYDVEKNTYKGIDISEKIFWYSRVFNSKYHGNLYLGKEIEIKQFLSYLYNEDWSEDDKEDMRDEIRGIIIQYSRYKIYHTNWIQFNLDSPHNLKTMKDWCDKMGDKRYEWGGVKS